MEKIFKPPHSLIKIIRVDLKGTPGAGGRAAVQGDFDIVTAYRALVFNLNMRKTAGH
jgi:hypothetical protein